MTKLKTSWAIRTTDEQFKAYIGTLEALGYPIYNLTKEDIDDKEPMTNCKHLGVYGTNGEVSRTRPSEGEEVVFPDISSFLVYHFSSEKTEAEKELEALQEKMNSLQEQIDRVKLSITK